MRRTTRHARTRPNRGNQWTGVVLALVLGALTIGLFVRAGEGMPMSAIDEHVHLDTHVRVHEGQYPHRGSLMTMAVVREWACGVGHEAGGAMAPCDHPDLGPVSLPSGIHTSGYIHYPTYFALGEVYRSVEDSVAEPASWVDTYRRWAALVTVAGLLTCMVAAWSLGLRGAALVGGTLIPSASAGILLYGTIANPQAAAIMLGALIAWAGVLWMRTGRGFWWLVAATVLASAVAVTHTLPAGAFMLAIVAALLLRPAGCRLAGEWTPRWWQLGVLTVVVVAPVVAYGRWITARATISNAELYSFAAVDSWRTVASGALEELFTIHSPWYVTGSLGIGDDGLLVQRLLRASLNGLPAWVTIAVGAITAVASVRLLRSALAKRGDEAVVGEAEGVRVLQPMQLLTACTVVGVLVYPVLLRMSNAINVGFDFPVVARYSIGFAPLLVWLTLIAAHDRPLLTRGLAALGTGSCLGLGLAIW